MRYRYQGNDYKTAHDCKKEGSDIQILSDGYGVKTLVSNPNKTVILNGERVMPLKEFHSLGGIVGLFHEEATFGGPFMRFSK